MKYLLLSMLGALVATDPQVPPLLRQALIQLPGVRPLNASTDLIGGGYTTDQLKYFHLSRPWLIRDVDRDRRPDVVAVVVRPTQSGLEFGVLAVHARSPKRAEWIVPLGSHLIYGITKGPGTDSVIPAFCIECDTNGWFRWTGGSYEEGLYETGERIAIGTYDKDARLALFAMPSRNSTLLHRLASCTRAIVRRVAGSAQDRWYFVETRTRIPVQGWLPASFLIRENECGR
jgi:hypothetical protein